MRPPTQQFHLIYLQTMRIRFFFLLTEFDFDSIARDRKRSLNYMEMLTSPYQQISKHIVRQQIGIFSSLTLC